MARYRLPEGAYEELDEAKRLAISAVSAHILTAEQAQRSFMDKVKRIIGSCLREDDSDTFPIICNGCGKVNVVASDVTRYECKCSPGVARYTFQSRRLDIQLGKSGFQDLMTSAKGRESVGSLILPTK